MIFVRSIPIRRYRNYRSYRALLRSDFRYRCAYCLTQEAYVGGDANFAIDHYHPRNGTAARPDLENEYANLYWTCSECNGNKADQWPSSTEEAAGQRWLDPCKAEDDHELHWHILPDGQVRWLTSAGEYTVKKLMLHRRDWLKRHWSKLYEWQQMRTTLADALASKDVLPEVRQTIEQQLAMLDDLLEPPIFSRPRRL